MSGLFREHGTIRSSLVLAALLTTSFLVLSCAPPQAIATFAGDAGKTFDGGIPLFADIHDSCLRRHTAAASISPNFLPAALQAANSAAPPEIPQCAVFVPQVEQLTKASKVMSAYFLAMQQIASFNTTGMNGQAEQTASNIGAVSGLNLTQVDSVSKLAHVLTQALTEHYRQADLVKLLSQADPSIASVTEAFADIASKDYDGLLREERQTLASQYQAVADVKAPATIFLLNRAYADDINQLDTRKAAAEAYVEALRQIREGHHELTKSAKSLKTKKLTAALQTYTQKIEALLPVLARR